MARKYVSSALFLEGNTVLKGLNGLNFFSFSVARCHTSSDI